MMPLEEQQCYLNYSDTTRIIALLTKLEQYNSYNAIVTSMIMMRPVTD